MTAAPAVEKWTFEPLKCKSCFDTSFVDFIIRTHDMYEKGMVMSTENLMLLAKNKDDILRDKGRWNDPSAQDAKILALESMAKGLSNHNT